MEKNTNIKQNATPAPADNSKFQSLMDNPAPDFTLEADDGKKVSLIVVDPKADWDGAVKQDPKLASATVLLDSDRKVSSDYGVLTIESSMHRGQFPGHTYLIVDKEGVIRFEKDDPNMGINNKDLLAALIKLNN